MNNIGDKGSPCFNPLVDLKKPYDFPFNTTKYKLLEISLKTMSTITSEKPNCLRTFVKKIQDTLS